MDSNGNLHVYARKCVKLQKSGWNVGVVRYLVYLCTRIIYIKVRIYETIRRISTLRREHREGQGL